MKNLFFFFALLFASAQSASAQTSSLVKTYIRAEETLRIGTVGSQAITGFNTTIPSVATNDKLPTTKAVKDFVNASFVPLGGAASGDLGGTWPSPTVDGLQGVSVSAVAPTTGQVLKYNGTAWAPGAESDPSTTNELQTLSTATNSLTLSNGGGTVTVDTDPANEIQELSISGSDLTLSNGGGTVTLPGGADGNGIYSGSGSVADLTKVSVLERFQIGSFDAATINASTEGTGIEWENGLYTKKLTLSSKTTDGVSTDFFVNPGAYTIASVNPNSNELGLFDVTGATTNITAQKIDKGIQTNMSFLLNSREFIGNLANPDGSAYFGLKKKGFDFFCQDLGISKGFHCGDEDPYITVYGDPSSGGLAYFNDHSAAAVGYDRFIPDIGTLKSGLVPNIPRQIAESASLNGEMFYSTDANKLAYKNAGGTITYLW